MISISLKKLGLGALTFLFAGMLAGCQPEGPAEKAGRNLDNLGKDVKNDLDPRGPAQKAGDSIDKAIGK